MPFNSISTVGYLSGPRHLSATPQTPLRNTMTRAARFTQIVTLELSKISNAERKLATLKTNNSALAERVDAVREGLKQVRGNCTFLCQRRLSHIVGNASISQDMTRKIECFISTADAFSKTLAGAAAAGGVEGSETRAAAKRFNSAIVAFETTIRDCAPDQKKKLKDKIVGGIAVPWILAYQIVSAYAMEARDSHSGNKTIDTVDNWLVQLAWLNAVPAVLSIGAMLDYLFTPDDCTVYLRTALVGLARETQHAMLDETTEETTEGTMAETTDEPTNEIESAATILSTCLEVPPVD